MTFQLFTQLGKWTDGIFNWFFNLNAIWQLIFFVAIVLIVVIISRSRR